MTKVPQRDEIWKHKEDGYLARITYSDEFVVHFYDNQDGCLAISNMENACEINCFKDNFVFIGNGKPINILFEMAD